MALVLRNSIHVWALPRAGCPDEGEMQAGAEVLDIFSIRCGAVCRVSGNVCVQYFADFSFHLCKLGVGLSARISTDSASHHAMYFPPN